MGAHTGTDRLLRLLGTRWLVRLPIVLYRARLGFLFGSRLLMLEHVGRRTGSPRLAVLEVVDRPGPGRYVVVAALGERTQWWQNARAHPAVRVSTGFLRSAPATARPLAVEEAAATLDRYARVHPRAWRTFEPLLRRASGLADGAPVTGIAHLMELRVDPVGS